MKNALTGQDALRSELLKQGPSELATMLHGAKLVCSREELDSRLRQAVTDGHDIYSQLDYLRDANTASKDIRGLKSFARWLSRAWVQGPFIQSRLGDLLRWYVKGCAGLAVEEKDRAMRSMIDRIAGLPLPTGTPSHAVTVGDVLPREQMLHRGSHEDRIELKVDAPQLLRIRASVLDPFEGSTNLNPPAVDPSRPPSGFDPDTNYYMLHGHSWWSSFLGVFYGSAYTSSIKVSRDRGQEKWYVRKLSVEVADSAFGAYATDTRECVLIIDQGICSDTDEATNDWDVEVSCWSGAVFGPFGLVSRHQIWWEGGSLSYQDCDDSFLGAPE